MLASKLSSQCALYGCVRRKDGLEVRWETSLLEEGRHIRGVTDSELCMRDVRGRQMQGRWRELGGRLNAEGGGGSCRVFRARRSKFAPRTH